MKRKSLTSVVGAITFFLLVAFIVTVAVMVYGALDREYHGDNALIMGAMLGIIFFLAAVMTLADYLRRKYTIEKSVERILNATNKIAAGDFSVRLDITHSPSRYNQFDYIMDNLNMMAAELSRTEVLHTDFISNLSHEIKTPLSVIQNYATSLQNSKLDEETRIKYAETLSESAKRLTVLVTNILKLNKLENQALTPEKEKINLTDMLAETIFSFEELIEKKQIKLACDLEENVSIVSTPSYLEIVWNNLISNAIKFTDEGGQITIGLKSADKAVTVTVSDSGCGISEETGKHIFEKFYQGDTSHAAEGNGLGLALVKKVIDKIGGKISVESELGVGTTFLIVLNKGTK